MAEPNGKVRWLNDKELQSKQSNGESFRHDEINEIVWKQEGNTNEDPSVATNVQTKINLNSVIGNFESEILKTVGENHGEVAVMIDLGATHNSSP